MSTRSIKLANGVEYEQPVGLFINNELLVGDGEEFSIIDPSLDEPILTMSGASMADVNKAVQAAREAYESGPWSEYTPKERSSLIAKLAAILGRERDLLAAVDAFNTGKPYSSALEEDLAMTIDVFEYYAGWADKIEGKTIDTSPNKLCYVTHEPLGVCAQIIPWNFPMLMLAWKVAPALACGNVVILKAAEQTPLSAMLFAQYVKEAGFPPGVINVLQGLGATTGRWLAEHLDIDKIAFTGSTITGKSIMRSASLNLKNVTLECGGKSPLIIFDDAKLVEAVKWAHIGIMDNAGQVCSATSRIYVQEQIYDEFLAAFVAYVEETAQLGCPFEEGVNQGPQISRVQYEKVLNFLCQGEKEGARVVTGGIRMDRKGFFIQPTVLVEASESSTVVREEVFGPVVTISKFSTESEGIAKANDSAYGLAAAVFTQQISRAHRVSRKLRAGTVWINSSGDVHSGVPFGGYKSSGVGRELGSYALEAYTQPKAVHVNLAE